MTQTPSENTPKPAPSTPRRPPSANVPAPKTDVPGGPTLPRVSGAGRERETAAFEVGPTLPRRPTRQVSKPGTEDHFQTADATADATATIEPQTVQLVAPETLTLTSSLARYQLGEVLGRGGMGEVKGALDPALRREIAIKLQLKGDNEEARRAFLDEAQITGQLEHPNVVPVHELGCDEHGRPFLAMKRIGGRTLEALLATRKNRNRRWQQDAAQALEIFGKVCDAIAYAHARGVVHRDLKPANIMVGDYGEVLVVDWGLAKPIATGHHAGTPSESRAAHQQRTSSTTSARATARVSRIHSRSSTASAPVRTDRRDATPQQTMAGDVLGTPSYMAPEQARGEVERISEATDIFALGGILYSLLTFKPPYTGKGVLEVVTHAAQRDLVPARQCAPQRAIPKELEAITEMAMHEDPRRRYRSVLDLKADVQAHLAAMPIKARRDAPWTRAAKWARRRPTAAMSATLCLVFGLVVALLGMQLHATQLHAQASQERADRETAQRELAEARQRETEQRLEREAAQRVLHQAQAAREEAERILAEQRAAEAQDLAGRLRAVLDRGAHEAYEDFRNRRRSATAEGRSEEAFAASLTQEEFDHYLSAFDALFEALEEIGVEPEAEQWWQRGLLRRSSGNLQGALSDFERAVELSPEQGTAYYSRATAHYELGNLERALADFDRALELNPNSALAYQGRGVARMDLGDIAGALADFDRAIEINPGRATSYSNRGALHFLRNEYDAAIADYDRAILLSPTYAPAYSNRGSAKLRMGDIEGALKDMNRALELEPDYAMALTNRGEMLRRVGKIDEALTDLDRAVELDPTHATAFANRARIHFARRDHEKALADFDRAIELGDNDARTYYNRGTSRMSLGSTAGAIADFDRAIELDPEIAGAYTNRGMARGQQRNWQAAIADYDRAIELDPTDPAPFNNRAEARRILGDLDEALADYKKASELAPHLWQPLYGQGLVLGDMERSNDAIKALRRAHELCPDPQTREQIAQLILRHGGTLPD